MSTIVIMAGGTGGYIYPALAVGTELRKRGINVYWMGVRSGLEDRLARSAGFEFDEFASRGCGVKARFVGSQCHFGLPFLCGRVLPSFSIAARM